MWCVWRMTPEKSLVSMIHNPLITHQWEPVNHSEEIKWCYSHNNYQTTNLKLNRISIIPKNFHPTCTILLIKYTDLRVVPLSSIPVGMMLLLVRDRNVQEYLIGPYCGWETTVHLSRAGVFWWITPPPVTSITGGSRDICIKCTGCAIDIYA